MTTRWLAATAVLVVASLPGGIARATVSDEARPVPTLQGRAILPAYTLAPGPPSGALAVSANGITFPLPSQGVLGFSSIVAGRSPGEYLAMPDNGFGAKNNSADFLIRAYYIRPDFKTAHGGTGSVQVGDFISFRDPNHLFGATIVNDASSDRLLTGADIDPESLQRGTDGDLWVGDEFGPWVLHFSAAGVLLDPPVPAPFGLMSPNNPHLNGQPATQPNSRGYESMAISPNGKYLYPALEGATVAEAPSTHRYVFEFSVAARAFTGRWWNYQTEAPGNMLADMWSLDDKRMVLIERDGGRGLDAKFRTVYLLDRRNVDSNGNLVKTPVVDLTAIADPRLVSLPAIHEGDVGIGSTFKVVCESIEAIYPISSSRLLLGCDNNLPNTGRNPNFADDTELIVVKVPGMPSE
jgi:hypothetical protein